MIAIISMKGNGKMIKEKLSKKSWFTICLFSFMGGIAWNIENMYFNTFLYNSVYANASEAAMAGTMAPTTAISRMVALSAIAAVLTTFIMGTLSDKMKNRKFFISVGYILWGIVTAIFGFITTDNVASLLGLTDEALTLTTTVWIVIAMDVIMTFMGSTSNDAAFNAWVTDITTPKIRPTIETALTFVGFLSVAAVMGVGSLAQSGAVSYKAFFGVLGLIVTACGVAGLFLVENPKYPSKENEVSSSYWADLFYGFRPSVIKENSRLYLALFAIGFSSISYQVFFPYLLVYLQYVVIPDNGDNLITTSVIITAALVIVALIAGFVILLKASAKNKAYGLVPCTILQTLGLILLSTSTDIKVILIGVVPTLVGNLVMGIQLNAAIKDFIPEGKAGLFQGIRMIFTVLLPMVIGPALGDLACRNSAITYANEFGVETIVPSSSMFLYAAIVSVFVVIPMIFLIKKGFKVEEK
ncbi:MAG: MFS transporter [Ruminococcaceae bacterium]|nr:MFS transporter [Oscillospiraceae bacterium]